MSALVEKLQLYWSYPFVRNALAVGVLIALCAGLLGVTLVLKRYSLIGTGLSHAAFGAMALASVLRLSNNMLLVLPVTVFFSVLLLRGGKKIQGDAAVAMLSVASLAFGYLILSRFSGSSNLSGDVCTILFGSTSILTLSEGDLWLSLGLSIGVVLLFLLLYHRIFDVTFDEDFARACGTRTERYHTVLAVVIAVIIVLAVNLVGSLLISALVVFPALSAMRVCGSFRGVTLLAALLSVLCAALGILIAVLAGTPVGSTIVAADTGAFLLCALIGAVRR